MISGAPLLGNVSVDVSFLIEESFYFGPENDFSQKQWETMREPLDRSNLEIKNGRVKLADLAEEPEGLLRYYRSVIEAAQRHKKEIVPAAPEFWLRPDFWRGDELLMSFQWHDTVEEAEVVLSVLLGEGDGDLYSDIDQGFELLITANRFEFTIRETDPDTRQVQALFRCERSTLARQATLARSRLLTVVAWLAEKTGRNFWTYAS